MSLFRSLEHHFCLLAEAQRSPLRHAPSVCACVSTGIDFDRHRSQGFNPLAWK
jgi:hypothetical protein